MDNPELKKAVAALAAFVLFAVAIPLPHLVAGYPAPLVQLAGYAASFLSLCSLFMLVIFYSRAGHLESLRMGKGVLARWEYTPAEWRSFAQEEHAAKLERNKGVLFIFSGLSLLAGLFFFMINSGDGLTIFAAILVLIVLAASLSLLAPRSDHAHRLANPGEIVVSVFGVVVVDELYLWDELGSRFHSVHYCDDDPPVLEFVYSGFSFLGPSAHIVRVPVPEGRLEEANRIIARLNPPSALHAHPPTSHHAHAAHPAPEGAHAARPGAAEHPLRHPPSHDRPAHPRPREGEGGSGSAD